MFVLSAAECGLTIVIQRRRWTFVISHGLHFVMAIAMAVMAWPWSARLPTTEPAVFFLLAAVWFVTMAVVAARTPALWALYGYHSLMMLATAWMYAIMNSHLLPVSMPGMDMAAMNMPASSGSPAWFGAVNWFGTVGSAVAAVFWTWRFFIERQHAAAQSRSLGNLGQSLGNLGQAMMAAGMTILFLGTLFPV